MEGALLPLRQHVPPNVKHSVKALSDGRAIVVDDPVRRSVGGVDL
jgi:quercetin dioxygenase-like cupin family protein